MSDFATSYVEYRCPNCGQILWSEDPHEIEILGELSEQSVLECPACHSKIQSVEQKAILHRIAK